MGLAISYGAWEGAYSAFDRLRAAICEAMGGTWPREHGGTWYWGAGYSRETHPGLHELLCHSDYNGEISPIMCVHVADELEALLPKLEPLAARDMYSRGHLSRGLVPIVQQFIAGCRAAAAAGEPLEFY